VAPLCLESSHKILIQFAHNTPRNAVRANGSHRVGAQEHIVEQSVIPLQLRCVLEPDSKRKGKLVRDRVLNGMQGASFMQWLMHTMQ